MEVKLVVIDISDNACLMMLTIFSCALLKGLFFTSKTVDTTLLIVSSFVKSMVDATSINATISSYTLSFKSSELSESDLLILLITSATILICVDTEAAFTFCSAILSACTSDALISKAIATFLIACVMVSGSIVSSLVETILYTIVVRGLIARF